MFRAVAIISVMAALVVTAAAQDVFYFNQRVAGGIALGGPGPVPEAAIGPVQSALNLSEAQVSGLKALVNQRTDTSKTAFQDLAEKQKTLQTLLAQQNPAAIDIGNAYLGVQSAQAALKAAAQKFQTDFQALLTADQRTTLQNLQNASKQIDSLRMLGVIAGDQATFDLPVPPFPGGGPVVAPLGAERSIRIIRKNDLPER